MHEMNLKQACTVPSVAKGFYAQTSASNSSFGAQWSQKVSRSGLRSKEGEGKGVTEEVVSFTPVNQFAMLNILPNLVSFAVSFNYAFQSVCHGKFS